MRFNIEDHAEVRIDVREALETRERMLVAMGFERVDGEWIDARSRRPITPRENRALYSIGDDAVTRYRKNSDSRWPWPSTYVPF